MSPASQPTRGFPDAEYEARRDRAQAAMAGAGIDALLLTTEPEVRYFTGFLTPFWQSPTRPWFLVVPQKGVPLAVFPSIGAAMLDGSPLVELRTWPAPQPADDGVSLLATALSDAAGANGTVGVPMGHETHLRMPLADYDRLQKAVSDLTFTDATDIIRDLRMVKSELEIAKTAHICSVVSDAFDRLPLVIKAGMTEREAFTTFTITLLECGADAVPYLVGATGPGFVNVIKPPSDRVIEAGDMLMFDTGSMFDGYSSDFDRNFAFGHAPEGAKQAYDTVWRATEAGLNMLRPGVTTTDLWRTMADVMSDGGSLGNDVGRLGHGLGMQLTEWPSNTSDDNTVIKEGMVLTLEPGMTWAPGKMMLHEENVVIRADGAELLSRRAAPELPIL